MSPCPQRRNSAGPSWKRCSEHPEAERSSSWTRDGWMRRCGTAAGWPVRAGVCPEAGEREDDGAAAGGRRLSAGEAVPPHRQGAPAETAQEAGQPQGQAWRAGENDWRQNKNYGRTLDAFQDFMSATDAPWARWKVIDGSHAVRRSWKRRTGCTTRSATALTAGPAAEQPKRGVAPAAHGTPVPGEIGSGPGGEGVPEAAEEVPEGSWRSFSQ